MEIIIGNDILNKSLPMGIVPILFSAAGAEVFSFVIGPPICMICLASQRKKAPTMYDTTICCKIQEKRKSS